MKNIGTKLVAVAFLLGAATPAFAGKGGSAEAINAAVKSGSIDAILAEVERTEHLMCDACIDTLTKLTAHSDVRVREVAAWWFAKRPTYSKLMADQFIAELASGTSLEVRNAADFLGSSSTFRSLPALRQAIHRDVDSDAKLAMIRAVDHMGNLGGNEVLTTAMGDRDAKVRAAAARAWRDIRGQQNAQPVVALLGDADAIVRAEAAAVIGGLKDASATGTLETMVVRDANPLVRKNAAWALGKIGSASSRTALTTASNDISGLVRLTARASLATLH